MTRLPGLLRAASRALLGGIAVFALLTITAPTIERLGGPQIAGRAFACPNTVFFKGYDGNVTPIPAGDGVYTNSLSITIDNGGSVSGGSMCHPYTHLLVSNNDSANMGTSGEYARIYNVSASSSWTGSMTPVTFSLSGSGGNSNQGTHTYYTGITSCTGDAVTASFVTRTESPYGGFGWVVMNGGSTCSNITVDDAHAIIYDNVAPASAASIVAAASSSRTISVPWTTSDTTSKVASVRIYYNDANTPGAGESLCTTINGNPVAASGTASCTVPSEGLWYFRANSTDRATNVEALGASYDDSIIVDTTAPSASFSTPASAGPTPQSDTSYTTTFSVSDSGSGMTNGSWSLQRQIATLSGINTCGLFTDDGSPTTATGGGTNLTSASVGLVTARCYRWVLTAFDSVSNSTTVASGTILIDTTVPIGLTITDNSFDGAGSVKTLYRAGTTMFFNGNVAGSLILTASATDSESGIEHFSFGSLGGTPTGWSPSGSETVNGNPASKTWTWAVGANATSERIFGPNRAGGQSTATTITVTRDSTAPTISIAVPASGQSYHALAALTVTFSATDGGSGFTASYAGWTLVRSRTTTTNGVCDSAGWVTDATTTGRTNAVGQTWTNSGVVADTCYRWTLSALDSVSNASAPVTSGITIIDATAPVVAFTNPATDILSASTGQTVAFTMSDGNGSGIATSSLTRQRAAVVAPGSCAGLTFVADGSAIGNPTSPTSVIGLADGYCYRWILSATDVVGNAASTTSPTVLVDTTAPIASWLNPAAGTTIFSNQTSRTAALGTAITWSESDAASGIATRSRQRYVGEVVTAGTCTNVAWAADGEPSASPSAVDITGLVAGQCYRWTVSVTDGAGNTSLTMTSGAVMIDTTAPLANLTLLGADGGITSTRSVSVQGTTDASDAHSGVASVTWAIDGFYNWSNATILPWPGGAIHDMTLDSGAGSYVILVRVTDYAGNVSEQSAVIDINSPIVPTEYAPSILIVDCVAPDDATKWVTNTSGVIYWPVGRPLCVVPGVRLIADSGIDLTDPAVPLISRLGVETSYRFLAQTNAAMQAITVWPSNPNADGAIVTFDAVHPAALRFTVTRETQNSQTIVVPYQAQYPLDWFAGEDLIPTRSNEIVPSMSFKIIAQNHGMTYQEGSGLQWLPWMN